MTEMCNCEHTDHFGGSLDPMAPIESPVNGVHEYMKVEAGAQRAMLVGKICDDCANGHLREYVEHPIPHTKYWVDMRKGHQRRHGHELTGYLLAQYSERYPDAEPVMKLERTCCQ